MKEIRLFIENTSAPYVNKIIFLYVDIFLVQVALCFIGITEDINAIMLLTFYPSFLLLFLIHRKRYKTFMSEGGLTPAIFWMDTLFAPASSSMLTKVCRHSCGVCDIFSCCMTVSNIWRYLAFVTIVPSLKGVNKNSLSG